MIVERGPQESIGCVEHGNGGTVLGAHDGKAGTNQALDLPILFRRDGDDNHRGIEGPDSLDPQEFKGNGPGDGGLQGGQSCGRGAT